MQLHKPFHPARAPSRLFALVKRDPTGFDLRLQPFFQGWRNVQVHANEMNIVQPLVVVIPSLLTHIWIFVVRCYAEDYDAPVVMVVEDLLELFDRCYRDDFVGFEGFWRFFRVVTVSFRQCESICYCLEMHFERFRWMAETARIPYDLESTCRRSLGFSTQGYPSYYQVN